MYKIGEFSALTGASVKTLRYYDQIGLLKPSKVDCYTSYRYYTSNEIQIFKRIEYLKKIGFTLEEIKNNLSNMTIECLEHKKEELQAKRDFIIAQISELDKLRENINQNHVKTLRKN